MNQQNDEEVLRKDYLLGKLNDQMRDQVEERLLDDDDFVEQLSATEDNLIDDYVFGALSESERKSFEESFVINDERREKLRFAQAVDLYLDKRDDPLPSPVTPVHPPWWSPQQLVRSYKVWIALPALVLLLLIAPLLVRWLKPTDPIAVVQANRAIIERRIAEFNKHHNQGRAYDWSLEATPLLRDKG